MAQDPLSKALNEHIQRTGNPLRVVVLYTGGTFACVENKLGLLEPVQTKEELEQLLLDGLNLRSFVRQKLLELNVIHLFAKDSSQLLDEDREKIIEAIYPEYAYHDGFIIIHGTDSGAETAKFLHLALPYNNPIRLWQENKHSFNWVKPVLMLSSQVPAGYLYEKKLTPRMHSDGPMNFALALLTVADGIVGEAGLITNNEKLIRGTAATKGAEIDIPPYHVDPGVGNTGIYTAAGVRYANQGFLRTVGSSQLTTPTIIRNAYKYETKILTVQDSTNLGLVRSHLEAKQTKDKTLIKHLEKHLPLIILYETRGAGNVKGADYEILKQARENGVSIFRVPIPGGRIPPQQMYDVPGHDLTPLNAQLQTARYKAMMTLALADELGIKGEERKKFIDYMMKEPWANEFLPQR